MLRRDSEEVFWELLFETILYMTILFRKNWSGLLRWIRKFPNVPCQSLSLVQQLFSLTVRSLVQQRSLIEFPQVYLFSISKMLTSVGVMISMERRPKDWYPQKKIHEFAGWEFFKDFCVAGTNGECEFPAKKLYDVTIAQLLTHTSGIPFSKEGNPTEIQATPLWFAPSEGWGYSIGHRILGWVLRDYWRKDAGFQVRFSNSSNVVV